MTEEATFGVVVNDEDQYSVWPATRPLPPGWYRVGPPGTREECLARVADLWTDLRPASLRGTGAGAGIGAGAGAGAEGTRR